MNGPTRSSLFDRRSPVRPSDRPASVDVFSELDQFVDSEPVVWAPTPRRRERTLAAEYGAGQRRAAAPGAPADPAGSAADAAGSEGEIIEAAFSREPASLRRDAFARRLSEELSRSPEHKAPPAPSAGARSEAMRAAPGADAAAKHRIGAAPATAPPPEDGRRALPPDTVAGSEPQDALDWELDNAIGAIIASGRTPDSEAATPVPAPTPPLPAIREARTGPAQRPAAEPATRPAAPLPEPTLAEARPPEATPRRHVVPVAPVGTVRRKPIPTFRFDRREEPDDPVPAVARDVDDPLANVFFEDVRQTFDAVHPAAPGGEPPETLSELDGDAYDPPVDEDDELPPSLVRAAAPMRERRRSWRSSGIAAAVVGIAGLAVLAVIGMNVFAGPGSSRGEPPIIRADARDVKVEPAADGEGNGAGPDIAERAALGESERLVLPDSVAIADAAEPDPEALEEELVSRQVRTVVVRPDGSIVPAEQSNEAAAAEFETADASAQRPAADNRPASELPAGGVEPDGIPTVGGVDEEAGESLSLADGSVEDGASESDGGVRIEVARADVGDDAPLDSTPPPGATVGFGAPEASATAPAVPRPRPPVPSTVRRAPVDAASRPAPAAGEALALQPSAAARPVAPATPWEAPATQTATEPAEPAAVSGAPWAVQLAAQRSQAEAETSLRNLRQRYPSIVGAGEPMIVAANVDGRGTFYRVRLPADSRGEAAELCERLKAAGADCFIGPN